jgi:hypothetical protein
MHSGNSDPLHSVHPSPISPPAPRKKADVTRIAQFNSNFMNSPQPIQPQSFAPMSIFSNPSSNPPKIKSQFGQRIKTQRIPIPLHPPSSILHPHLPSLPRYAHTPEIICANGGQLVATPVIKRTCSIRQSLITIKLPLQKRILLFGADRVRKNHPTRPSSAARCRLVGAQRLPFQSFPLFLFKRISQSSQRRRISACFLTIGQAATERLQHRIQCSQAVPEILVPKEIFHQSP